MKLIKNNFQLGGIQPLPALLDCLIAPLSNKGAVLLMRRALLGEQFDPILSFYITNFLIVHNFCYNDYIL